MDSNTSAKRRHFLKLGASVPMLGLMNACGSDDATPLANTAIPNPTNPTESPDKPVAPNPVEPPVVIPASHPPRGVHASLFNDAATSRGLCWFTDGLDSPASEIQWGPIPEGMSIDAAKNAVQNPLPNVAMASTSQTTGLDNQTHKVVVAGIDPERPFRYRVGSENGGWSDVFIIEPTPKANDTWTMVHFGDHGIGELPQRLTAELMKPQHKHDLLLLAGDLSYANGEQAIWDVWFDQNQALLATTTTMAVPGNHENKDSVAADVPLLPLKDYAFNNRFNQPGGNSFYSFDYNRVHFFGFTAGAFLEDGKILQELATLEADLALARPMTHAQWQARPVREKFTEWLASLIDTLRSRGVAILYISHRLSDLQRVADRAIVLRDGRLAGRGGRWWWWVARDQQHAAGAQEVAARAQVGEAFASVHASVGWVGDKGDSAATARSTAARISMWVPQRHRLPERASRTVCGLGWGLCASRAAVVMIMPFRQ